MAKYKALRNLAPYPYDGTAADVPKGTTFEVDERDPEAKKYLAELGDAVEPVGKTADLIPEVKKTTEPEKK